MPPKVNPPLRARLMYYFDNFMSRGTLAIISGLGVLSLLLIAIAGVVISLGGRLLAPAGSEQGLSFGEAAWESLMRTLDAGTMGGDEGWGYRFAMLLVTIGGILIVSALIGVVSAGVEGKLAELRKGRSRVLENGHILILGWSAQIFTILNELINANLNQKKMHIVILADKDKVEMEDEIRSRINLRGSTGIICRSGQPIDLDDIEISSPHTARSIIILPPEDDHPDSYVIKTLLAIVNHPNRNPDPYHIITQVRDPDNLEVINLLSHHDRIQPVLTGDLIARLTAQTSRQSGLSVVYTDLLNFSGDEIYFCDVSSLTGKTYRDLLTAYETSSVMGLFRSDGTTLLNPPMDTVVVSGDQAIALSEDDDTLLLSGLTSIPVDDSLIHPLSIPEKNQPERTLVLGWNQCASSILQELDQYVPAGSSILLVTSLNVSSEFNKIVQTLKNQLADLNQADPTQRRVLDGLNVSSYDHIIVLSEAGYDLQSADARTLVTLLHLRDIANASSSHFSIVSEMLDERNRKLAEAARVDDFIISEHIVSLMMSQLSENWRLHAVFTDLFNSEGSEIYLKPIDRYMRTGLPVNFYTLVDAASRRGETAIGYRLTNQVNGSPSMIGVVINPDKSKMITFTPQDKLIVLAES